MVQYGGRRGGMQCVARETAWLTYKDGKRPTGAKLA